MQPVECLADAVAFCKYIDLGSLMLTNKQFSDLAVHAAGKIRISDLSAFDFVVGHNRYYYVYSRDRSIYDPTDDGILSGRFTDDAKMTEFVSEAFRHCVVGNLEVEWCSGRVLKAMKDAARTIIVTDTLTVYVKPGADVKDVVDLVDSFQQVKVSKRLVLGID